MSCPAVVSTAWSFHSSVQKDGGCESFCLMGSWKRDPRAVARVSDKAALFARYTDRKLKEGESAYVRQILIGGGGETLVLLVLCAGRHQSYAPLLLRLNDSMTSYEALLGTLPFTGSE